MVDRAPKLADADGLDALTIRKLARDLGVSLMALYWHFRSKDDLLEGMAEQVWGEIDVHVDPSVPWSGQLQRQNEIRFALLPAAQYPRLVKCAAPMAAGDPGTHYQLGVELFIAGVRALAERLPGGVRAAAG